jgi:hypothetical protein
MSPNASSSSLMSDLPGSELLTEALDPSRAASVNISSCLLSMARVRLERAGLALPEGSGRVVEPELTLYRLLRSEGGDAFSRYNGLIRRLISFERAWEKAVANGPG